MNIFLVSLSVVSSLLLIVVILLQQGKGADLGAAFGRGAQGSLFTATGKANFLTRITSALVTVFLLSALTLSVLYSETRQDDVFQQLAGENDGEGLAAEEEEIILGAEDGGDASLEAGAGTTDEIAPAAEEGADDLENFEITAEPDAAEIPE